MTFSETVREKINKLASCRILILDGAMGSLISNYNPGFDGICDLLCLTIPDIVSQIHEDYLKAGADIIETCSFNAASIALDGGSDAGQAYRISYVSAVLAREAVEKFSTKENPKFVAGSIGPAARSASISSGLGELEAAYYENARGLIDGGADFLIIETVFDALNAKAAVSAARQLSSERGIDIPVIISATLTEEGRLLSGQTVEAFCASVEYANPLALGLNCSFGVEQLKPFVAAIAKAVPCLTIAYPNAGLPDCHGLYSESPESMAGHIEEYLLEGFVNIVGGCCGSTPEHISSIAKVAKKYHPRSML